MYLAKSPSALRSLTAELMWKVETTEKVIYLTFDDGPSKEGTRFILDILKEYNAKATFFCIGGNVAKNPALFGEVLSDGHSVGNHTWNHMDGWKFSDFSYFRNIVECGQVVDSNLFRPPYGRIKISQAKSLAKRFKIVMWDVLSGDWDSNTSPEKCLNNVVSNVSSGSIVVFHDSQKAFANMSYALPKALEELTKKGFVFRVLPQ